MTATRERFDVEAERSSVAERVRRIAPSAWLCAVRPTRASRPRRASTSSSAASTRTGSSGITLHSKIEICPVAHGRRMLAIAPEAAVQIPFLTLKQGYRCETAAPGV